MPDLRAAASFDAHFETAKRALASIERQVMEGGGRTSSDVMIARAQVEATLANAAATMALRATVAEGLDMLAKTLRNI